MPLFRKNYLPSQSQQWVREIEQRILSMESSLRSEFVNNRTRDDQLLSSYNRLDKAFQDLAAQQSTLAAQQVTLGEVIEDVSDAAEAAALAATAAGNAATTANNAIDRLETYSSKFIPVNDTSSISNGQTSVLNYSTSQNVSLSGGGSRNLSVTAIISIELGVNSVGTSTQPHRVRANATISVGGTSSTSETFVGVRKYFTDTEISGDSRVVTYGGGTLAPSSSRTITSSGNVSIGVSVTLDNSELNSGAYFGTVKLIGLLVNIAGVE